jgi:hypothetical protein
LFLVFKAIVNKGRYLRGEYNPNQHDSCGILPHVKSKAKKNGSALQRCRLPTVNNN